MLLLLLLHCISTAYRAAPPSPLQVHHFLKLIFLLGASLTDQPSRPCVERWIDTRFELLMSAGADTLNLSEAKIKEWAWTFELAEHDHRRYMAYKFMYAGYTIIAARKTGANVTGGALLHSIAAQLFGSDAVWCLRKIKNAVTEGRTEPGFDGRSTSFPRDAEAVLYKFISKLRSLKVPVFKSTVIDYAKRLLSGTEASLAFAKVVDGKYVMHPVAGVEWDEYKLHNWFHRRFIGDRKADGNHIVAQTLDYPCRLS